MISISRDMTSIEPSMSEYLMLEEAEGEPKEASKSKVRPERYPRVPCTDLRGDEMVISFLGGKLSKDMADSRCIGVPTSCSSL